jgi:hypothetical protein
LGKILFRRTIGGFLSLLGMPGVHARLDHLVHGMEPPVSDFFLHQSFGFRLEFYRHTSNLVPIPIGTQVLRSLHLRNWTACFSRRVS